MRDFKTNNSPTPCINMEDKIAGNVIRKERKRHECRTGRPSKVKRLQETLGKNAAKLQQTESRIFVAKNSESEALNQAKVMER